MDRARRVDGYTYRTARDFDRLSAVRMRSFLRTRRGLIKNIVRPDLHPVLSGKGQYNTEIIPYAKRASSSLHLARVFGSHR